MNDKNNIPFGMLFEETEEDSVTENIVPVYEQLEKISFVYLDGKRIPYATWSDIFFRTKTGDNTKTISDDSDTDPMEDR